MGRTVRIAKSRVFEPKMDPNKRRIGERLGDEKSAEGFLPSAVFLLLGEVHIAGVTGGGVFEVALDQVIARVRCSRNSQRHVEERTIRSSLQGLTERPGALIGILSSLGIDPSRPRVGIGGRLLQLVRNDRNHRIHTGIAVGTHSLN